MIDDFKKKGEENLFSSSSESRPQDKDGEERETPSDSIDISRKLEECQKQKEEYLQGWQRARADFLNYKKEEMERIGELFKYAGEEWILKILPILDNFDVVEKKLSEDLKNNENIKGFLQVKRQLENFLKSQGVEEIKTIGERFDPNFHEIVDEIPAIAEVAVAKEVKSKEGGIIMEEIQKGYKINGRLLRPAKVKVVA